MHRSYSIRRIRVDGKKGDGTVTRSTRNRVRAGSGVTRLAVLAIALALGWPAFLAQATDIDEAEVEEQDGAAVDADNTGINKRDRGGERVTAFDQGNSEADRNITASIRKAVVADDTLSMNAHNVKIITVDGVVTLRGPVESAAEKSVIEAKARSVAGVARVDSQLEVDTD
jgi:osmotically-inducible protein OsmY